MRCVSRGARAVGRAPRIRQRTPRKASNDARALRSAALRARLGSIQIPEATEATEATVADFADIHAAMVEAREDVSLAGLPTTSPRTSAAVAARDPLICICSAGPNLRLDAQR